MRVSLQTPASRGFDALDRIGATHIVFTNGLKDGWSVGGVRPAEYMRAQEIYVFDLPNGAHHSGTRRLGRERTQSISPNNSQSLQQIIRIYTRAPNSHQPCVAVFQPKYGKILKF